MFLFVIYYRVSSTELARLTDAPESLNGMSLEAALKEGRALDLGRAWEELGCLLEGGIAIPESGPTVGEELLLMTDEGVAWNAIRPERVAELARGPMGLKDEAFLQLFSWDDSDTADFFPGDRTGQWGDQSQYLYEKFQLLRAFYRAAADAGEAILVRLGPQRREQART